MGVRLGWKESINIIDIPSYEICLHHKYVSSFRPAKSPQHIIATPNEDFYQFTFYGMKLHL